MAEVEIQPKAPWRNILTVTPSAGPTPPAGTAIITLDGPHELTDDDGAWVTNVNGISGISESSEQAITVLSPTSVSLDFATSISGSYTGGGYFRDDRQYAHRIYNSNQRAIRIGSALYYVMYYLPGTERIANLGDDEAVRMYKSTDDGASWTHMDAAGEPKAGQIGVDVQGTMIWTSYSAGGVVSGGRTWESLFLRPYNTLTDTWGAESPAGPLGQPPGAASFPVVMADGRVLLYYEHAELRPGSSTIDSRRPAWAVYNPATGLWDSINNYWSVPNNTVLDVAVGTPPQIQTTTAHGYYTGMRITIAGTTGVTNVNGSHTITVTGTDTFTLDGVSSSGTYGGGGTTWAENLGSGAIRINGVAKGEGNLVHFFYGINISEAPPDRAYVLHRSFDQSTLVLVGTEQVVSSNAVSRFNGCGVPLAYSRGGATQLFLGISYQEPSSLISKLQQAEAASAINPIWSTSDITIRADLIPAPDFAWSDAAYDPTLDRLWFFFSFISGSYPVTGDSRLGIAYKSKTPGSSWGADTTWKTDSNYSYSGPAPTVDGGSIRVVYAKLRPEELHTLESPLADAENFPHIDVVDLCPPTGGKRYSYFRVVQRRAA